LNFYLEILAAILPVFIIIFLGLFLRRFRALTAEADQTLTRVTVNVLYPLLVLSKTCNNPTLRDPANVLWPALSGLGFVLFALAAAYYLAPLFGVRESRDRRTFGLTTGIQNYGFIAIPVLTFVFHGNDQTLGVLFAHSLGVEIALWTAGILLLTGAFRNPIKSLLSPPLVSIVLGLVLNAFGLGAKLPVFVTTVFVQLGNTAIPLSLLLIGASIHDLTKSGKWLGPWRMSLGACLIRLALVPAAMLAVVAFAPITEELQRVLVVQAAMPAALFPIILSRHYGGNPQTAVQVVIITTAVSILTIPLVVLLGRHIAGW
jgi:predicted permease